MFVFPDCFVLPETHWDHAKISYPQISTHPQISVDSSQLSTHPQLRCGQPNRLPEVWLWKKILPRVKTALSRLVGFWLLQKKVREGSWPLVVDECRPWWSCREWGNGTDSSPGARVGLSSLDPRMLSWPAYSDARGCAPPRTSFLWIVPTRLETRTKESNLWANFMVENHRVQRNREERPFIGASPAASDLLWKVEQELISWDPKDGELCLCRMKAGETLMEVRSDTDVQIVRLTWV